MFRFFPVRAAAAGRGEGESARRLHSPGAKGYENGAESNKKAGTLS